jgi:hypothetical protein
VVRHVQRRCDVGETVKVGIVICGRYGTFAGGKCFRAVVTP